MPTNKKAMMRVRILDELLSDKYHAYTIEDLVNEVNMRLPEGNFEPVTKRCIEKDLNYIESVLPGDQYIERVRTVRRNPNGRNVSKKVIRYEDSAMSVFSQPLTVEEKTLLHSAMSMIGQIEGLPELAGLERLQKQLGVEEGRRILSMTKNPMEDSSLISQLYTAIAHGQVILITYHTHAEADAQKQVELHPQLLREYNRRWYLFATASDTGRLLNFALDQIEGIEILADRKYIPFEIDLEERFGDIVGVTLHLDKEVLPIELWVSDLQRTYVESKPIHESQRPIRGQREQELRSQYPTLQGGALLRIECVENYELIRELCSYGADLVVLSPDDIRSAVRERTKALLERYD